MITSWRWRCLTYLTKVVTPGFTQSSVNLLAKFPKCLVKFSANILFFRAKARFLLARAFQSRLNANPAANLTLYVETVCEHPFMKTAIRLSISFRKGWESFVESASRSSMKTLTYIALQPAGKTPPVLCKHAIDIRIAVYASKGIISKGMGARFK